VGPMDELRRLEARQLARAKVRSKRRRTSVIRRRTARASLGLFAILWAIIFGRLASGNDPALGNNPAGAPAGRNGSARPGSSGAGAGRSSSSEPQSGPEVEVITPDTEGAAVPAEAEPEPQVTEPEPEYVEPEIEYVEPEPEPVITGSS
jgi:hypothetical protein